MGAKPRRQLDGCTEEIVVTLDRFAGGNSDANSKRYIGMPSAVLPEILLHLDTTTNPPGHQWYWKADFVRQLSGEAIALHLKHGAMLPTMQSTMHMYPINGKARSVKNSATPWSYRDATWAGVIVGVDPNPANKEKISSWARDYWDALHPHSAGGAYVNFMMDEGEDRVRATYGKNYNRLAKIKKRYDPTNLFRVNQNIAPAK